MQLATINNIDEQNVAVELIRPHLQRQADVNDRTWIGGNDLGEVFHWYWQSTGLPIQFSYWADGEPNNINGNERCVNLEHYGNLQWNDLPCGYEHNFLCEEISIEI